MGVWPDIGVEKPPDPGSPWESDAQSGNKDRRDPAKGACFIQSTLKSCAVHVVFKHRSAWPHSNSISESWLRTEGENRWPGWLRRRMTGTQDRVMVGEEGREQIQGSCLRQQNSQGCVFPGPSLYFILSWFFLNVWLWPEPIGKARLVWIHPWSQCVKDWLDILDATVSSRFTERPWLTHKVEGEEDIQCQP